MYVILSQLYYIKRYPRRVNILVFLLGYCACLTNLNISEKTEEQKSLNKSIITVQAFKKMMIERSSKHMNTVSMYIYTCKQRL